MIKIDYPIGTNKKKFESQYYDLIKSNLNINSINRFLRPITYNGTPLTLKLLIQSSFTDLVNIINIIEQYFIDNRISTLRISNFKKRFDYEINQPKIANFFMEQKSIDISTCYYCNIDFINAFRDISDYESPIDFVNNAKKRELLTVKKIGERKAEKIIEYRSRSKINSLNDLGFSESVKKELLNFKVQNDCNHFTLDHVIPKSKYQYLSLSLYNFVPSCYSCNSKFKKDKEFSNLDDLKYISPSSDDFSLDSDLAFKIYYKNKLEHINLNSDFILKEHIINRRSLINEYFEMFKINGRYVFHKSKIKDLIQKTVRYPKSKIEDISKLTGITQNQIKSDVFGKELFKDDINEPLVKLRKDIAKNLNIIP